MTALERMASVLPLPYASDPGALVTRVLDVCASEVEAAGEDIERMRRSHWIERAYRGVDSDKLAALVDVRRFQGEPTPIFLQRLAVFITARLQGAVGPRQIRQFVYDYLAAMERLLECTLVPGLRELPPEQAWQPVASRPAFRPLALVENPPRVRRSRTLSDRGGRVTHLCRWTESNRGLDEAPVVFRITGIGDGVTAMPSILNLATRTLIGFRGAIRPGRTLTIGAKNVADDGQPPLWQAHATMEGRDMSAHLYAIRPFIFGGPYPIDTLTPAGPILQRGPNELMYLAPAMLDQPALDHVSLMVEDPQLREAVLDQSTFDHALFPTAVAAHVEMSWTESEPASFEVRIPRGVVVESKAMNAELHAAGMRPPREEVADDLHDMLPQLRAAGVRAELRLVAFSETQPQFDRFTEPGRVYLDPERAPTGQDRLGIGARFDETPLNMARLN
jgi:hypothetical protein